jgi:Holliday junction resolvase
MKLNAPNALPALRAPMGGRRSRDKGARAERALVRLLQDRGFAAERVPLSGSAGGRFSGDITIPLLGVDRIAEVKIRGTGFRQLYEWLNGRDLLIVRADRHEALVILPLRLGVQIAQAPERGKAGAS